MFCSKKVQGESLEGTLALVYKVGSEARPAALVPGNKYGLVTQAGKPVSSDQKKLTAGTAASCFSTTWTFQLQLLQIDSTIIFQRIVRSIPAMGTAFANAHTVCSVLLVLRKALFTTEDTLNFHKILGFFVLAHIIYRFALIPFSTSAKDLLGFGAAQFSTPLLIALHSTLSLSSFVFHIPFKRYKEGTRIWPEFRLHSVIFAHRALASMLVVWIDAVFPALNGPRYWLNIIIVFATLFAADLATRSVPPEHSSRTVSNMQTSATKKAFFSFMQFLGTMRMLLGVRSFDGYFVGVLLIQVTAFSFTLRRKNLISHESTIVFYAFQLVVLMSSLLVEVFAWAGREGVFMLVALSSIAMVLRIPMGMSKYTIWAIFAIVIQYARATTVIVPEQMRIPHPAWVWPTAALFAIGILVFTMIRHNAKIGRGPSASHGHTN